MNEETRQDSEEGVPLGSWNRLYALVLGVLALEIVLFFLFTAIFD